jgi:hypothetical protein
MSMDGGIDRRCLSVLQFVFRRVGEVYMGFGRGRGGVLVVLHWYIHATV